MFAALFGTSTVLFRLSVPADPGAPGEWLDTNSGRVKLALWLVPFGGIAFLWFIGVVRDRLGDREDRFLSSVMFGSGLLYLAMTFAAAALVGALIATYEAAPEQTITSGIYAFDRQAIFHISNNFGVRMAGVFMFSTGSIWLRSGAMPRWIIAITYLLALVQLVGVGISLWSTMVFPIWVSDRQHPLPRAWGRSPRPRRAARSSGDSSTTTGETADHNEKRSASMSATDHD